jgi:lipopolysaccharide/colanic/teichoic acid biosynthesis glycosyltransferase
MLKRRFDVIVSALGLLVLSPLLLVLALLVKLSSPGTVLYRATRVGLDGQPFRLLKFRSMVANAAQIGPAVTGAADSRITPIGRFLRRTKLDELPQLLNVLRGEMSLVGPRPEDPRYVALYTPEQRRVLSVRPGITSPASIAYRSEEAMLTGDDWETHYIQHVMPAKLEIDLQYVERASLLYDLKLIFRTFISLFRYDRQG